MKSKTYVVTRQGKRPVQVEGPDLSETTHLTLLGFAVDGTAIVRYEDGFVMEYGLTPCCFATTKGTEWGIACRECYQDADPALDLLSARDVVYTVQED